MGGFQSAVESADLDRITATLAPDVVFHSPAVHRPYEGREITSFVLAGVLQVFEDFHYVGAIREGRQEMLRFSARVGDRRVDGVDIVTYDEAGLVAELSVMIRPHSALTAVKDAMGAALAAAQTGQPSSET